MGEPLATLPPSVPLLRTGMPAKRLGEGGQLRAVGYQGGKGVGQRHRGTDGGWLG